MTIADIQSICSSFKGNTEDIKWETHLCFNVGGKMYLITSPDEVPCRASLKVTEEDYEILCEQDGIIPAPHLARYNWIQLTDISIWNKKEWEQYLSLSYRLVFNKLPRKIKAEIQ